MVEQDFGVRIIFHLRRGGDLKTAPIAALRDLQDDLDKERLRLYGNTKSKLGVRHHPTETRPNVYAREQGQPATQLDRLISQETYDLLAAMRKEYKNLPEVLASVGDDCTLEDLAIALKLDPKMFYRDREAVRKLLNPAENDWVTHSQKQSKQPATLIRQQRLAPAAT